ncbi:MAG TPA: hypothetical protein VGF76_07305, partial [Polyangiaceae bacterium]
MDQVLPPVQTDCPDAMPESGSPCDGQENSICVWQTNAEAANMRGYRALGCYSGLKGKIWSGVDATVSGGSLQAPDASCPRQAPKLGDSCPNRTDVETCIYPTIYCECGSILPGQWLCDQGLAGKSSPPVAVQRLCPPANLDETLQVKAMGSDGNAGWCVSNAIQTDERDPPISGKDSPGVADSYSYQLFSTSEMSLCLADLPVKLCEQNLGSLGSKCTATIGELDDCVETIHAA